MRTGFTYVPNQDISSGVLCGICKHPMMHPTTTSCEHNFCQTCIREALMNTDLCPDARCKKLINRVAPCDKDISRYLDELLVQCNEANCTEQMQRQFYPYHAITCDGKRQRQEKAIPQSTFSIEVTKCEDNSLPAVEQPSQALPLSLPEGEIDHILDMQIRNLESICKDSQDRLDKRMRSIESLKLKNEIQQTFIDTNKQVLADLYQIKQKRKK